MARMTYFVGSIIAGILCGVLLGLIFAIPVLLVFTCIAITISLALGKDYGITCPLDPFYFALRLVEEAPKVFYMFYRDRFLAALAIITLEMSLLTAWLTLFFRLRFLF